MTAPAPSQQPPPKPRSRKLYVLWGVALTLLLSTALFCWLVVVPVWQVHRLLETCALDYTRTARGKDCFELAIESLGGPDNAVRRLNLYLRMPKCVASHRHIAATVLGYCGEQAVPALLPLLEIDDDNPDFLSGLSAKDSLVRIGPPAIPSLIRMLEDRRRCFFASQALKEIGPPAEDAVPALSALLMRAVEPASMAAALREIGGPRAVASLKKGLAHEDPRVREVAAVALKKINAQHGPLVKTRWTPRLDPIRK